MDMLASITKYTGLTLEKLFPDGDSDFINAHAIQSWIQSDVSNNILRRIKSMGNFPLEGGNWEHTFYQYGVSQGNGIKKNTSTTVRGRRDVGGLIGFIYSLMKFVPTIERKKMARLPESGSSENISYVIQSRRLINPTSTLRGMRGYLKGYGRIEFLDAKPKTKRTFCTAKTIQFIVESDGKLKNQKLIDQYDIPMSHDEFVNAIQTLQGKGGCLKKNVAVYSLRYNGDDYFRTLLHPKSQMDTKKDWYHIYLYDDHVYYNIRARKRRQDTCDICQIAIDPNFLQKHYERCKMRQHQCLDIYSSKNQISKLEEYTMQDFHRMDEISNSAKDVIIKELELGNSVYLNAPGGSGKTWLINEMIKHFPMKTIWVMTPTGISAQAFNGNGKTWHRYTRIFPLMQEIDFQTMLKIPKKLKSVMLKFFKYNLPKPDIVVLEEVSMIRGVDIEFISSFFKICTGDSSRYFGGIPVLVCGDAGQLPPVDPENETVDWFFMAEEIANIRLYGCVVALDVPRRLQQGVQDPIELIRQYNIQRKLRLGQVDPDLFNIIGYENHHQFIKRLKNGDFLNEGSIIVAATNKQLYHVVKVIYGTDCVVIGKDCSGGDLYVSVGMRLIITDNGALNGNVFNGTEAIVDSWQQKDGKKKPTITVIINGEKRKIRPGAGYATDRDKFPCTYYHVRTSHRVQGMTLRCKMYFFANGDGVKLFNNYNSGQIYTIMTRCIDMRNIIVVKKDETSVFDIFNDKNAWTFDSVCQVIQNPKKVIGINIMDSKSGIVVRDTRNITGYVNIRNVQIETKSGRFVDSNFLENERIFHNTLIEDHETGVFGDKHVLLYSAPIWYFRGKVTYFDDFILRNGGSIEGLPPFVKYPEGFMEFSIENTNDRSALYIWLDAILQLVWKGYQEMKKTNMQQDWPGGMDGDLNYFFKYTMHLVGFNNKNYDDRFLIQHMLKQQNLFELQFICGAGSKLNGIAICFPNTEKTTVVKSFDLLKISGPGGLAGQVASYVESKLDDPSQLLTWLGRFWLTGETPINKYLNWHEFSEQEKLEECMLFYLNNCEQRFFYERKMCEFEKIEFHDLLEFNAKNFAKRCKIAGERDSNYLEWKKYSKKGCTPLFLAGKMSIEEYRNATDFDLIEYMTVDGNLDWRRAFFPREIPKAKKMLQEKGIEYFRHYNIPNEMREYAQCDVMITKLLMQSKNNAMYFRVYDCYKRKHTWNGRGMSLFKFETTAEKVTFDGFANLPKEVYSPTSNPMHLQTKIPLMPKCMDELVDNICGGKTQGRRIFFSSTDGGVNDWFAYFDNSGMYMYSQIEAYFPYGKYTFYNSKNNLDKMGKFLEMYNRGDPELFTRCRLFQFRAKHHSKEIENVLAVKGKYKLEYTNEERIFVCGNYNLKVARQWDVEIFEFINVVEWEEQCQMFRNTMMVNAHEKAFARDSVVKGEAKLDSNAGYGAKLKKQKNSQMLTWKTANDAHAIHSQYPEGIKRMEDMGELFVGVVEDHTRTVYNNAPYLGSFVLDHSKTLLYDFLFICMNGRERFEKKEYMPIYGDTDSVVINQKCIQNVLDYDALKSVEDKWIWKPEMGKMAKAGKYICELSDDVGKYMGKEYEEEISKRNFPCYETGYMPRIIFMCSPQAKTGIVKMIFPPLYWPDGEKTSHDCFPQPNVQDWNVGYKCFIKGVQSDSYLRVQCCIYDQIDLNVCTGIRIIQEDGIDYYHLDVMGHNCDTFELIKYSMKWSIPINTVASRIKSFLFTNEKEKEKGIEFGDLRNEVAPKNVLGYINNGRLMDMKPDYIGKDYRECARQGVGLFTCCTGYSFPSGYD